MLFVVGAPGVGKTTALAALLDPFTTSLVPRPKWTISPPVALVGHYGSGDFSGGDTVPYNGAAIALDHWFRHLRHDPDIRASVFDGDRFSSVGLLRRMQGQGLDPACLLLTASDATLADRRHARGSKQNPSWMKGRATKAHNFSQLFDATRRHQVNTDDLTPDQVTTQITSMLGLT